jgi:glycosyltransferase involved in cell wall biosynthesis
VRILYFSKSYTPHDHRFLEAASGFGHEVHYLMLRDVGDLEDRPIPSGIDILTSLSSRFPDRVIDFPTAYSAFSRTLTQVKPELIHAGPVHGGAFLSALKGGFPLVTMSWGSDILLEATRGWKRRAAAYALERSDVFICDCEAVKIAAVQLGVAETRVVQFPWGVDLDKFHPISSQDDQKKAPLDENFVLLSTRALELLYGVDIIVEAFVRAAREEPKLRLVIVGSGSQRENLERRLAEAGLSHRAVFKGHVSHEELPAYYQNSDLYVSASHSDGSSVSLLEAMASGLPALVSDIPGNKEWVIPGENGWLFKDNDAGSLADGLVSVVRSKSELATLGASGRRMAESRADWGKNKQLLEGAYQSAIRGINNGDG